MVYSLIKLGTGDSFVALVFEVLYNPFLNVLPCISGLCARRRYSCRHTGGLYVLDVNRC
jgi:hypothetical protein